MAVFPSAPLRRRRWTLALTLLALALALAMGGVLWQCVETASVAELQGGVAALKPVFTTLRLSVIALTALAWPVLMGLLARWGRIDDTRRAGLLALRWRLVGWLVVIELVLGQSMLGQFLEALRGILA